METATLFDSEILIFATREEANAWSKQHPEDRSRIWLDDEVKKYLLADENLLRDIVFKKLTKPGCY